MTNNKPLVQASLVNGYIRIQVMPGVTNPAATLMEVADACAQAAQGMRKPTIQVAPPGMRVARSD